MKWLTGTYWLGRCVLAVPFWFASGFFLGGVELCLILARSLRLGQMGCARVGNWLVWDNTLPDSVDMKIDRRLNRLTSWRDKPNEK